MSRRRAPRDALQQADDELQAEIDRAEKAADAKYAAAEKRARDEARDERERYLLQMKTWGSTLYLFPMLPALFGVLTICVVSVVLNTDYRQRDGQTCNSGVLNTYLLMSQILAYVFLFGYACMFIGTRVSCMGELQPVLLTASEHRLLLPVHCRGRDGRQRVWRVGARRQL